MQVRASSQQGRHASKRSNSGSAELKTTLGTSRTSGSVIAGSQAQRPPILYWELLSQEDLDENVPEGGTFEGPDAECHMIATGGDLLIFSNGQRPPMLRRFHTEKSVWGQSTPLMASNALGVTTPLSVQMGVPSPISPGSICLFHCPEDIWNSDYRYEVHTLDSTSGECEALGSGVSGSGFAPKKRLAFSVVPFERSLFFFGGMQLFPGDTTGSLVYRFDLDGAEWTQVKYDGSFPAPQPGESYLGCRFGMSCAVYGGRAWFFGGSVQRERGKTPVTTNDFHCFDLKNHAWIEVDVKGDARPPPMFGHSALIYQDRMLVCGGGLDMSESTSCDVWSFEFINMKWQRLPPTYFGPRLSDGRIVCCLCGERLIAYQRWQLDEMEQSVKNQKHALFALDVGQVLKALQSVGLSSATPLKRAELDLLGDESTADVEFRVENSRIVAHRSVLRRFSPTFARMFENLSSPKGESSNPAMRSSVGIVLSNVTPQVFTSLLEHIYSRFSKAVLAAEAEQLLEQALRFEVSTLVRQCQECITVDRNNATALFQLCESTGPALEILRMRCVAYLTTHIEVFGPLMAPALSAPHPTAPQQQPSNGARGAREEYMGLPAPRGVRGASSTTAPRHENMEQLQRPSVMMPSHTPAQPASQHAVSTHQRHSTSSGAHPQLQPYVPQPGQPMPYQHMPYLPHQHYQPLPPHYQHIVQQRPPQGPH